MSPPSPDPLDDLLRQALRAEAEGVEADDELLRRTRATASGRPGRRRLAPWLLSAAAAAAMVALAATVLLADDDQTLDVVDDPALPTTTTAAPDPDPAPADGARPTLAVVVRDDGMLVTIDLASGKEVELHSVGDPHDTSPDVEEGGPYSIDAVDLSPDGQTVYFSTCCEPASGNTYRIPITGGDADAVAVGAAPGSAPTADGWPPAPGRW